MRARLEAERWLRYLWATCRTKMPENSMPPAKKCQRKRGRRDLRTGRDHVPCADDDTTGTPDRPLPHARVRRRRRRVQQQRWKRRRDGAGNAPGVAKIFNVRGEGAAGDGATDDTAAFQQALTRCAERGGGEVVVPAGQLPHRLGRHRLQDDAPLRARRDDHRQGRPAGVPGAADPLGGPLARRAPRAYSRRERARRRHRRPRDHRRRDRSSATCAARAGRASSSSSSAPASASKGFSINYERMWAVHPTYCQRRDDRRADDPLEARQRRRDRRRFLPRRPHHQLRHRRRRRRHRPEIRPRPGRRAHRPADRERLHRRLQARQRVRRAGDRHGDVRRRAQREVRATARSRAGRTRSSSKAASAAAGSSRTSKAATSKRKASAFLRIDLITKGIQDEQPVEGLAGLPVARNFRFENVTAHDVPFLVDAALDPAGAAARGPVAGRTSRGRAARRSSWRTSATSSCATST